MAYKTEKHNFELKKQNDSKKHNLNENNNFAHDINKVDRQNEIGIAENLNEIVGECPKKDFTTELHNRSENNNEQASNEDIFKRQEQDTEIITDKIKLDNDIDRQEMNGTNSSSKQVLSINSNEISLDKENLTTEKEKAERKINKQKKDFKTYLIFILANALVVLIICLLEDNNGQRANLSTVLPLISENWIFIVLAFAVFIFMLAGDTVTFYILTRKMGVKKAFGVSLKTAVYGRYYDKVTPWAIGGEPFQIAFLTKSGMSIDKSSAITMSRHIIRFFVTAVAVIIILSASRISAGNVAVMVAAILSVLGGLIVPIFMVICCFSPKIGIAIAEGILKFLHKLKIVKDYDKAVMKVRADVASFLKGIEYLSANKFIIIVIGFFALTELFGINGVPYFVIRALGIDASYWKILVLCLFVNYSASFAPTPGGAGIAELSFYAIFASYLTDGFIFWAVLIWRLAVFYAPVILGFLLVIADSFKGLIASKKCREKNDTGK